MREKVVAPTISSLEDFEHKLSGYINPHEKLAVLMDYDGTLAPIADNPNKTAMSVETEIMLNKIAKHPNIFMAIISGRALHDVRDRVGICGITYAGNHGLEIENHDGQRHDYQLPDDIKASYKKLVKELVEKLNKNKAWVEDKKVSLTYHYRDTPPDVIEKQKALAIQIIESYGFKANQAHEAIEAKPPVNWNKGEAALYILRTNFGNDWDQNMKVIFAGDDTTDEDAMRALQGKGKSFRISEDSQIQTFADYRLPKQVLVKDLLKWISNVYTV